MKTAISIPDDLFEQVTRAAAALGVSRSAFFARAAEHYVQEFEADSLTAELDAVADIINNDASTRAAVEHGRYMLSRDAEDW